MWQLDFHFSCVHQCLGVKIILFDSVPAQSERNNNIKLHTNSYKVTNSEVDKAHHIMTQIKHTHTVQNNKTSGKSVESFHVLSSEAIQC